MIAARLAPLTECRRILKIYFQIFFPIHHHTLGSSEVRTQLVLAFGQIVNKLFWSQKILNSIRNAVRNREH